MKILPILLLAFSALASSLAAATVPGPKGGRLLDAPPHRAEFSVGTDRRVEITFYDDALKPIAHGGHQVKVFAELPDGRQTIELQENAHGFASTQPLPAGEPYRIVVQFRSGPQSRAVNHRIDLNLAHCGGCDRAEYACTCDH